MPELNNTHHDYPELFQLVAGFFNQDFFDDYATEAAALADYIGMTSATDRKAALAELVRLREAAPAEPALAKAMAQLGSAYGPLDSRTPIGDFADRIATSPPRLLDESAT